MIKGTIQYDDYYGNYTSYISHECDEGENECYQLSYHEKENVWTFSWDYAEGEIQFCPFCGEKLEITDDTIVFIITRHFLRFPYENVQREREYEKKQKEREIISYKRYLDWRDELHEALNKPLCFSGMFSTGMAMYNKNMVEKQIDYVNKEISKLDIDVVNQEKKECNCECNLIGVEENNIRCGKCGKRPT